MHLTLERALFVVAPQDSGKSTVLRSMFLDRRLGMNGAPPTTAQYRKLAETYWLSNERRLYLRLTSPHEYGESLDEFINKTRLKTGAGRWNFAGPLQPGAFKAMPDVVDTVQGFISALNPERTRVAFLSPNRHGKTLADYSPGRDPTDELLELGNVEVVVLDGRRRGVNGLMLADFFDFT